MAQLSTTAIRFAEAIFQIARDAGSYDLWLRELAEVSLLVTNAEAARVLASPAIPRERKQAILDQALPGLSDQVRRLLVMLARRERLPLVPRILEALRDLIDRERGLERVSVTTAVALDDAERDLVRQRLAARTGKQIQLEERVDPSLIGGVIAQIGDQVIDGSVRGRLERLRHVLAGN